MSDNFIHPLKIRLISNVPSRVFKYVDVADAGYLLNGNLKIGTLRGYAALEGSRADQDEGSVTHTLNYTGDVIHGTPEAEALREYAGIHIGPDSGFIGSTFENCSFKMIAEDTYCLCFSLSENIPHPDGKLSAVFEVLDFEAVIRQLARIHNFDEVIVGVVTYQSRTRGDVLSPLAGPPDPFTKPPAYEWEQEVRVLFRPKQAELEKFLAEPDPVISRLMARRPDV